MKKYHVATGDGKAYYGVGYESYRQAESLLKISQEHDPQAHIVEEEYHFTNADRIRAMSDEELTSYINKIVVCHHLRNEGHCEKCPIHPAKPCDTEGILEWLKQPVGE